MSYGSVFDIIDLEDGDASVLLVQARVLKDSYSARYSRRHFCERKYSDFNAEYNSICQGCEKKSDFLRFVLDCEQLICYDCFYESCKLSAEFASYHGSPVEDLDEYVDDCEWEELWAEENPHMIYDEEDDEYYDRNKPRRKKTKEEVAHKKAKVKRVSKEVSDYYAESSGLFD